jgi:hypothetical protein
MKKLAFLALSFLWASWPPAEPIQARDDFLFTVQDAGLNISAADLLRNDQTGSGPAIVSIGRAPRHGSLTAIGGGFRYRPASGFFGSDTFTYSFTVGGQQSGWATVTLQVAPDDTALHGDFDGDGSPEWGWYDSAASSFHGCFASPPGCRLLLQAPTALAGRAPLVGDWDADGDDDFGLFDAASGRFYLYSVEPPTVVSFVLGSGGGQDVAVAGDWNGDGRDTVGLYGLGTGRFRLRDENAPGPFAYDFLFAGPPPTLFVDRTTHAHTVAFFLPDRGEASIYAPLTGERTLWTGLCQRVGLPIRIEEGLVLYDYGSDTIQGCGCCPGTPVLLPPDSRGN